jgi:hypothetical protein
VRRYTSYSFTTSALDGGEWSVSLPGRALPPGKGPPGTHWKGGWVDPRAGLDTEVRRKILLPLQGIEPQFSVRLQHPFSPNRSLIWALLQTDRHVETRQFMQ